MISPGLIPETSEVLPGITSETRTPLPPLKLKWDAKDGVRGWALIPYLSPETLVERAIPCSSRIRAKTKMGAFDFKARTIASLGRASISIILLANLRKREAK